MRDVSASQLLYKQCYEVIKDVDIIVAEIPIGSQSASAMISYGICVGVLGSLITAGKHIIRVTPQAVKKVTGYADATKEEVMEFVISNHPELNLPMRKVKGQMVVIKKHIEHVADSIAALHAAKLSIEFNQLVNLPKRKHNMKLSYVLAQADIKVAIMAHIAATQKTEITEADVTFAIADGEVTALVEHEDAGAGTETKASTGRGSRGGRGTTSKTEADTAEAETEDKPTSTRGGRGSRTKLNEEAAEDKPASTGRAARGSRTAAATKPTVPTKSEDAYEADPDGYDDEKNTYWKSNDGKEVFMVPAGQVLPHPDDFEEVMSEEALELVAANDKPTTTGRTARGGRGSRTTAAADNADAGEDKPASTRRTPRGRGA